ncbi:hypothetical protein, partial [Escherichia coli]|uniref:hypothetical protein n=1 Tax=Escherichia coli TaxID=562 RepID=UPI00197A92D3
MLTSSTKSGNYYRGAIIPRERDARRKKQHMQKGWIEVLPPYPASIHKYLMVCANLINQVRQLL